MKYRIKNWTQFQHYKNRRPPWIKLHRTLLDDCDYLRLHVASRALAPLLWLIASESEDGTVECDLSFRLRLPEKEVTEGIKGLLSIGYIECLQDASTPLADCKQETRLETEKRRIETETEERPPKGAAEDDDLSFFEELRKLYSWLDLDKELAKMRAWQLTPKGRGRKLTRAFMVRWLNRNDKPVNMQDDDPNGLRGAV